MTEKPGNTSNSTHSDLAQIAKEINTAWRKGTKFYLDVAERCARTDNYSDKNKAKLIALLDMHTFYYKFLVIGRCKRLYAPDVRPRLPTYWTTLYYLAKFYTLSPNAFEEWLPHLSKTTKRQEIEGLISNLKYAHDNATLEEYPDLTEQDLAEFRRLKPIQLIERLEMTVFLERQADEPLVAEFVEKAKALASEYNGAIGAVDLETGEIFLVNPELVDAPDEET